MTLLLEVLDQTRVVQTLVEKTIIKTEEVQCGGDMGDDANEAARNLVDFHLASLELKRMAGDLHRIAEDMLTTNFGATGTHTVDGTTFQIRRAYRRTDWEHSRVATHVALRALGGEVIEGMDVIVDAFLKACSPSWHVTALKEMGLSDEDYCSRELGRASVTVM